MQTNHNLLLMLTSVLLLLLAGSGFGFAQPTVPPAKVPVVVVTDLYHPHQDVGDNFDLLMAYALPEVDLKAVILDCSEPFRQPRAHPISRGLYPDEGGPRDAGFIPVLQLNYLFNRNVPVAVGPFGQMRSPADAMRDLPAFRQQGVELLAKVLRESREPVHILSFGSMRPLAVAYNRFPDLLKAKVARLHLSAGTSRPNFLEWNIALDTNAVVTLLRSPLPIALYPCAAGVVNGVGYGSKHPAFSYDPHNTYIKLPDSRFVRRMHPRLQRYLDYAYGRSTRSDFLHVLEADSLPGLSPTVYDHEHYVWEPALWMQVTGRRLVQRADSSFAILPRREVRPTDRVLVSELRPCTVSVQASGEYAFQLSPQSRNRWIYYRADPYLNERALRQALPSLYETFRP